MSDLVKYVVRFFNSDDSYLYSIHCSADILDEILEQGKSSGLKFKIVAYKSDDDLNSNK